MRKVSVFNQISIDGFFKTPNGDIKWLHQTDRDDEFRQFTTDNASGEATLVFGRTTYEMMASFWPTPAAAEQFPEVARDMNRRHKIVFSRTLEKAAWSNTTVVKEDPATAIKAMKSEPGDPMVIMGSGSIVSQLTRAGLIDEYQILVLPVVLGEGKTMFDGAKKQLNLTLTKSRTFKNGRAFLVYELKA